LEEKIIEEAVIVKEFCNSYGKFVDAVTSDASSDLEVLIERLRTLATENPHIHIPALLTAGTGLTAEAGEFNEVVKKIVFQGKPLIDEAEFHMKRELGDILWYVMQACKALGTGLDEIIRMNIDKLKSRYPGGEFDVYHSENRAVGDV